MKKTTLYACMALSHACAPGAAQAYDIPTHYDLAEAGVLRSRLARDPNLLRNLGLGPLAEEVRYPASMGENFAEFRRNCRHGTSMPIVELVACGAQFEDHPGTRSLNHFYDPVSGGPLSVGGIAVGVTSPDWILQDEGAAPASAQRFAYRNARNYLYLALTAPDRSERERNWGLTFETLGHVVHHLEDMAQPQHVRNDQHVDKPWLIGLYAPSAYEAYTRINSEQARSIVDGAAGSASVYGAEFSRPRQFWKGANGLAQYTNSHFLSAGTNFRLLNGVPIPAANYALPVLVGGPEHVPISQLDPALAASVASFCGASNYCEMTFHATATSKRASTVSIFDQEVNLSPVTFPPDDRAAYRTDRLFTLNRFNFAEANQVLLPKAVAYSAGLLDYFFRGEIGISLPDEGMYSLVDHAQVAVGDPVTGFSGFNKIKVKLANLSKEPAGKGTVRALLRFRRNLCFTDELGGFPPTASADSCVGKAEEVVFSGEQAVSGLSAAPSAYTFSFPAAMPINAIHVRLQIVFRGTLGEETDAIVSAVKNISEPSFVSVMNDTDYMSISGVVYRRDQVNGNAALLAQVVPARCTDLDQNKLSDECFKPAPLELSFGFGMTTLQAAEVRTGQFVRLAFLGDATDAQGAATPSNIGKGVCNPATQGGVSGLSPLTVSPMLWETIYSPQEDAMRKVTPQFVSHRGVPAWVMLSCLYYGDTRAPRTDPGWDAAMTAVGLVPAPLRVNGGAGF